MTDEIYYEVLWYTKDILCGVVPDEITHVRKFSTKDEAMNFYQAHKNDKGTYGWWVTKANKDTILESYIEQGGTKTMADEKEKRGYVAIIERDDGSTYEQQTDDIWELEKTLGPGYRIATWYDL